MQKENKNRLEHLEQVVSVYGIEPDGWPFDARRELEEFARTDAEAVQCIKDYGNLPDLLDASKVPPGDAKLKERILSAALNEENDNVVAFAPRRRVPATISNNWLAASALAASLFLGIFAGATDYGDSLLNTPLAIAGFSDATDNSTQMYDFIDGLTPGGIL